MRPYDILVNVIAPGAIITQRILSSRKMDDAMMLESGTQVRYGWPIEISRAVKFLVSGANTYITGQVLRVDGGLQAWPA
jgi:3-oxoacyl-[acyl-carrier protein] reductase